MFELPLIVCHIFTFIYVGTAAESVNQYMAKRNQILKEEQSRMLGGTLVLSDPREMEVNEILMKFKRREYSQGLDTNGKFFAGAKHFFHSKDLIDGSEIYKIIRLLPKGAALHTHMTNVGPTDFTVQNLTRSKNLYYCEGPVPINDLKFRFFPSQPETQCSLGSNWTSVRKLRDEASSQYWVDDWFYRSMSMVTKTPEIDYPDNNVAWEKFSKSMATQKGIIDYEHALRKYYYNVLKYHFDDNVMYVEVRGGIDKIYRLDQSELTSLEVFKLYNEVNKKFKRDFPEFWGAKVIYTTTRFRTPSEIGEDLDEALLLRHAFPSLVAGFDISNHEDFGSPLLNFIPQLLTAADKGMPFFFHAGETDWHGTKVDDNVVDAVLLNTKRIGHGYALGVHPYILELVKDRGIGIEVNPISNQVLRLVADLRNHRGSAYLQEGFPVVISGDGSGMSGSSALSHDWYLAFMALAGERDDLRFLKQLALNSIEYSAMTKREKKSARAKWEVQWSLFLDKVLEEYKY